MSKESDENERLLAEKNLEDDYFFGRAFYLMCRIGSLLIHTTGLLYSLPFIYIPTKVLTNIISSHEPT